MEPNDTLSEFIALAGAAILAERAAEPGKRVYEVDHPDRLVMVNSRGVTIGWHDQAELDAWEASSGAQVSDRWSYEADLEDDLPAMYYIRVASL